MNTTDNRKKKFLNDYTSHLPKFADLLSKDDSAASNLCRTTGPLLPPIDFRQKCAKHDLSSFSYSSPSPPTMDHRYFVDFAASEKTLHSATLDLQVSMSCAKEASTALTHGYQLQPATKYDPPYHIPIAIAESAGRSPASLYPLPNSVSSARNPNLQSPNVESNLAKSAQNILCSDRISATKTSMTSTALDPQTRSQCTESVPSLVFIPANIDRIMRTYTQKRPRKCVSGTRAKKCIDRCTKTPTTDSVHRKGSFKAVNSFSSKQKRLPSLGQAIDKRFWLQHDKHSFSSLPNAGVKETLLHSSYAPSSSSQFLSSAHSALAKTTAATTPLPLYENTLRDCKVKYSDTMTCLQPTSSNIQTYPSPSASLDRPPPASSKNENKARHLTQCKAQLFNNVAEAVFNSGPGSAYGFIEPHTRLNQTQQLVQPPDVCRSPKPSPCNDNILLGTGSVICASLTQKVLGVREELDRIEADLDHMSLSSKHEMHNFLLQIHEILRSTR